MKKFTLQKIKKAHAGQPGFIILFTILIAAIILMIGIGIFSIATRETVLSGTAREAQLAFYAADAGVECALYAEGTGQFSQGSLPGNGTTCGAIVPRIDIFGGGEDSNPFVFDVLVDPVLRTCAHVSVYTTTTSTERRVIAQGFNICDATGKPIRSNPSLVERDLDTRYGIGADLGTVPSTPAGPGSTVSPDATATGTVDDSGKPVEPTVPTDPFTPAAP